VGIKKLEKARMSTRVESEKFFEFIVDFDNDRHHAVRLDKGATRDQVVKALQFFVDGLARDKHLDG